MNKLIRQLLFAGAALFFLGTSAGCPDYSHLREEPDYENMTDGGEPESEDGQNPDATE